MKALEELFVETTLDLLSSLPIQSAKTQLAHWYTQKTKRSLTMSVLRVLVLKTVTVPQAKRLVHLGISYQTLQNICYASSTDADFGKALAGRNTKSTSPREACGPNPNLRSRASTLMPHLLLYFIFVTNWLF